MKVYGFSQDEAQIFFKFNFFCGTTHSNLLFYRMNPFLKRTRLFIDRLFYSCRFPLRNTVFYQLNLLVYPLSVCLGIREHMKDLR